MILLKIPVTKKPNLNNLEIYENLGFLIDNIIKNYKEEVKDLKDWKNEQTL